MQVVISDWHVILRMNDNFTLPNAPKHNGRVKQNTSPLEKE